MLEPDPIPPAVSPLPEHVPGPLVPRLAERWVVGVASAVEAMVWGWAGWILPWQSGTLFSMTAATFSLACTLTVLASVFRSGSFLRCWLVTSWLGFGVTLLSTWIAVDSGVYLSILYGQLGEGIFAVLAAIWGLVALTTLPLAVWGVLRVPHPLARVAKVRIGIALAAYLALLGATCWRQAAQATTAQRYSTATPAALEALARILPQLPAPEQAAALNVQQLIKCEEPPLSAGVTIFAVFLDREDSKPHALCKQGTDVSELLAELAEDLASEATRSPVAIDIVESVADLASAPNWLAPLALRPGLDGACVGTRCLAPWQLLGRGTFSTHAPIDFLPEIRFGVSHAKLRKWLKSSDEDDAYQRIATKSFVLSADGKVTELKRLQALTAPTLTGVAHAESLFEQHILAAQLPNGQFRYTLDPFNGKADIKNFGLARQAGTAYALCDVGSAGPAVTAAAKLALTFLSNYQRTSADGLLTGMALPTDRGVDLGPSALSLIAFLRCRERLGAEFDPQIRSLSRFILSLQTETGVFIRGTDPSLRQPKPGSMALYSQGQALLALLLLETELSRDPLLLPGVTPALATAIDRAMAYTAGSYWHHAMYPFFFLEENWHCLAARAALTQHRNPRYEQFCLDYVQFKSRLILASDSQVDPELVGGFGLGNLIPPHSAGAAGFGEAVAAALTIERARGGATQRTTRVLEDIVGLVLRQQRTETNSFGCVKEALGGFPEQVHVPLTRIDFAQHAWSAVAHAKSELAW